MRQLALTQIAIRVVVSDDTGQLETIITALTTLLGVIVTLMQLVTATAQFVQIVVSAFSDTIQSVIVTLKLLSICYNSLAFGLGVRLC